MSMQHEPVLPEVRGISGVHGTLVAVALMALGLTLTACRRKPVGVAVPARGAEVGTPAASVPIRAGGLGDPHFAFAVAVYHLPRPTRDPNATVARLISKQSQLTLAKNAPEGMPVKPTLWLAHPPVSEYRPPDRASLGYFGRGLSEEEKSSLAGTREVSVLAFSGPGTRAIATYRQALALVEGLVRETGGLIWDEEARLMFSLAAWAERREGWTADGIPDVRSHISAHAYRNGELIRIITLGMRKFALPDVVVNHVATGHDSMNTVINLLCQRLIEGAAVARPGELTLALDDIRHAGVRNSVTVSEGARPQVTLRLGVGERDQGDPDNRLVEVLFPGPASERQEKHAALLVELFGREQDSIVGTEHDDELLAASPLEKK